VLCGLVACPSSDASSGVPFVFSVSSSASNTFVAGGTAFLGCAGAVPIGFGDDMCARMEPGKKQPLSGGGLGKCDVILGASCRQHSTPKKKKKKKRNNNDSDKRMAARSTRLPLVVITIGDPSGIGPEVTVKALCCTTGTEDVRNVCRPLVIGDARVVEDAAARFCGSSSACRCAVRRVQDPQECTGDGGVVEVLDVANADPRMFELGKAQALCGAAAMQYVRIAAELCMSGVAQAMCNAPLNKEATVLAGFAGLGHLEYLKELSTAAATATATAKTTSGEVATMLISGRLRVVHLTTHHPLRKACEMVTKEHVLSKLRLTHSELRKWGFGPAPRIAVAALNPHGGEQGLFGREEIEQLEPAVVAARAEGINASGPIPADSVFNRAAQGEFDAVLALYHDQGHIAVKMHGFERSVSVALGLPFVRTSVDHGTAFDIAGKGVAQFVGMVEAIRVAASLAATSSELSSLRPRL